VRQFTPFLAFNLDRWGEIHPHYDFRFAQNRLERIEQVHLIHMLPRWSGCPPDRSN
jgi:hypothetical protein